MIIIYDTFLNNNFKGFNANTEVSTSQLSLNEWSHYCTTTLADRINKKKTPFVGITKPAEEQQPLNL